MPTFVANFRIKLKFIEWMFYYRLYNLSQGTDMEADLFLSADLWSHTYNLTDLKGGGSIPDEVPGKSLHSI